MKPTVYVETSVISYYTSRPSSDRRVAANQRATQEWWKITLPKVQPLISAEILAEISAGDTEQTQRRLQAVGNWQILPTVHEVTALAHAYLKRLRLPKNSQADAFHLAHTAVHELDFLVTWNCRHIANSAVRRVVNEINTYYGRRTPVICTPPELNLK